MPQYMLSVHGSEDDVQPTPDEMQEMFAAVDKFNAELQESGAWVFAGGLHPISSATVVKADGGDVITTDGPFAESREHLGGFWVVDAPDLDAALALAARGSKACRAAVEVRPFQDEPAS
jgi:hypothetical protein